MSTQFQQPWQALRRLPIVLALAMTLVAPVAQAADASAKPVLAAEESDQADPRLKLLEAVLFDDAVLVRKLVLDGVDPNAREVKRGPALVMAATENSFAALAALLEAPGIDLEAVNANGETALMMAAFRGHESTVRKLIDKGAAVNRKGWTPLHYAAANGHIDSINVLIEAGADLNAVSPNGTTAMMMAARMGYLSAYQELVLAGANPTLVNQSGLSAADYLERRGETDRAQRLRQYAKAYAERQSSQ